MSYLDYAELFVASRAWDTLADEMFWEDGFDSELCLRVMRREAESDGETLTDFDSFDYDDYFYRSFDNTEKGLS